MPEPSTVAASTQRPARVEYCSAGPAADGAAALVTQRPREPAGVVGGGGHSPSMAGRTRSPSSRCRGRPAPPSRCQGARDRPGRGDWRPLGEPRPRPARIRDDAVRRPAARAAEQPGPARRRRSGRPAHRLRIELALRYKGDGLDILHRRERRGFLRAGAGSQHGHGAAPAWLSRYRRPWPAASPARTVTSPQRFADHRRGHVPTKAHPRCHRMPCGVPAGPNLPRRTRRSSPPGTAGFPHRRYSMTESSFVPLPGSERQSLPGAHDIGPVDETERIEVTLITRRRAELPDELVTGPDTISPEELADSYGTDPADIDRLLEVLGGYGLEVTSALPESRRVKVAGTAAQLSRVFGTTLRRVSSPDLAGPGEVEHRYREGRLMVPAVLAGIVVGVLGLDNRPQVSPHFRLSPEAATPSAYTPPQVAQAYQFPADTDGTGQTIAILEFGGGFAASDLESYFSGLGLAVPSITAASVDGAVQRPGLGPGRRGRRSAPRYRGSRRGGSRRRAGGLLCAQHGPGLRRRDQRRHPGHAHPDRHQHQLGRPGGFVAGPVPHLAGPGAVRCGRPRDHGHRGGRRQRQLGRGNRRPEPL